MLRIASEFGFTPASRSRIATPSTQQPTLFDELEQVPKELDPDDSSAEQPVRRTGEFGSG
jgi:hypothetical protein